MEGLRNLSKTAFDQSSVLRSPPTNYRFDTLSVVEDNHGNTTIDQKKSSESEVAAWAASKSSNITLMLIRLDRGARGATLQVSENLFSSLVTGFRANLAALYMIGHDYDGFHSFPGGSNGHYLPTWFVGTPLYAVMWTFDTTLNRASAIFINRRLDSFSKLVKMLEEFKNLAYAPHLVGFTIAVHQLHHFDSDTSGSDLHRIKEVETKTGFSPWSDNSTRQRRPGSRAFTFSVTELAEHLRNIREISGQLANKIRHLKTSQDMLDAVLAENAKVKAASSVPTKYKTSLEALSEAVPIVQKQTEACVEYLVYLQHRTERLAEVVSASYFLLSSIASTLIVTATDILLPFCTPRTCRCRRRQ